MSAAKIAFEMRKQEVDVAKLLPTKVIKEHTNIRRYKAIVDSLPEVGLIEPLMSIRKKADSVGWCWTATCGCWP